MTQLKTVAQPFGEVNVHPLRGGRTRVVATILMEPRREGTQTGIALDGSGSMSELYGLPSGSGPFRRKNANLVTPVAQQVCAYLARRLDADGGTTCVYWATGTGGAHVELVGDLTADQAERHAFDGPEDFGTGTRLLPAVRYFVDRFADAPWGFYVFITDGELHDLEEVKNYSTRLAKEIAAGHRKPLKFVLIGVGQSVNERQMEELDDLDTGTGVDLWDHKLAAEMRALTDIFAEVVDRNARVADRGKILDPTGRVLRDYSDTGVPGVLEFEVPDGTPYFTLEADGQRVHQPLVAGAAVPPPETPPSDADLPVAEEVVDDDVPNIDLKLDRPT
ncbi:VWA domain-containing protein [bacterium]|nr:VWA domain-containing protein [bacterium]